MNMRFRSTDPKYEELQLYFQTWEEKLERSARCIKILAHPARLKIMHALSLGERSVQDLSQATGLAQAPLSQHLSLMKDRNIVASKRSANFSIYRIANQQVLKLYQEIENFTRGD